MRITLPNGKWRKRLKIKALPPFAELHKVRAGNYKIFNQKLKWFRRTATRYDKLDTSFPAFVYIAAIAILLIQLNFPCFSNKA